MPSPAAATAARPLARWFSSNAWDHLPVSSTHPSAPASRKSPRVELLPSPGLGSPLCVSQNAATCAAQCARGWRELETCRSRCARRGAQAPATQASRTAQWHATYLPHRLGGDPVQWAGRRRVTLRVLGVTHQIGERPALPPARRTAHVRLREAGDVTAAKGHALANNCCTGMHPLRLTAVGQKGARLDAAGSTIARLQSRKFSFPTYTQAGPTGTSSNDTDPCTGSVAIAQGAMPSEVSPVLPQAACEGVSRA